MDKRKYSRLKEDPSQLQMFADEAMDNINEQHHEIGQIEETLPNKASLVDGKVPASQLPSYVDDVVEYASLNDFPEEGEAGKIYLAIDTGFCYRWSGTQYIQIAGSTSVLMFTSQANFPAEGEEGVIYVAEDTNKQYRWNGTAYVELGGETAANIVELTNDEVGGATLSEARVAQIEAADGLLYQNQTYWKYTDRNTAVDFVTEIRIGSGNGVIDRKYLTLIRNGRTLYLFSDTLNTLPRNKIISDFSSSKSYFPGDMVYYNYENRLYRCITAHSGAWSASDFTQVVLADEIHSDIVTVTATGVQSDEMDVKIRNAKALLYNNKVYLRKSVSGSSIIFHYIEPEVSQDTVSRLSYNISSKSIGPETATYNRTFAIGGAYGNVSLDDSINAAKGSGGKLSLTGKLPYLTTAPTADNTSGFITIVVLSAEPATRYDGYLYIITGSN